MTLSETVLVRLPAGTREALKAASARHGLRASDYLRENLIRALIREGLELPLTVTRRRVAIDRKRQAAA